MPHQETIALNTTSTLINYAVRGLADDDEQQ
jgi:hypothetical protein